MNGGTWDGRGLAGWPVNLLVRGRRVVVVGAGRIAARKIEPLLDLGADVVVVAPTVGDEVRAWADAGRLRVGTRPFDRRRPRRRLARGHRHRRPRRSTRRCSPPARRRRVWVNSADDPANCSFTLMSIVRRADLVVAIGTGGRSPALATWLKRHVTDEMGPEYETLLDLLSEARESLRGGGRSSEDADWQQAFRSGILDLVREGRVDEAKELLRSCL